VEPPTGTNGGPFVRVGGSTRDKKPLSPTLARLAVGPGTKATFYPGPKGNQDKWPETKAYSVVVAARPAGSLLPPRRALSGEELAEPGAGCRHRRLVCMLSTVSWRFGRLLLLCASRVCTSFSG